MFGIFLSPRDKFFDAYEKAAYAAIISLEKSNTPRIEKIVLTNILASVNAFRLIYKQNYKDINDKLIIDKADFVYANNQNPNYFVGIFSTYFIFNLLQVVKNDKKFSELISGKIISNIISKLAHWFEIQVSTINNLLAQLKNELKDCDGDIMAVYEFIYAQTLLLLFGRERAKEMLSAISENSLVAIAPSLILGHGFSYFIESIKKQLAIQPNR